MPTAGVTRPTTRQVGNGSLLQHRVFSDAAEPPEVVGEAVGAEGQQRRPDQAHRESVARRGVHGALDRRAAALIELLGLVTPLVEAGGLPPLLPRDAGELSCRCSSSRCISVVHFATPEPVPRTVPAIAAMSSMEAVDNSPSGRGGWTG